MFKKFPKIIYDIENNGASSLLVNIFKYVTVKRDKLDKLISYQKYQIVNGDRPDNISYNLYGREDYHWTFFLINEHLRQGIKAWPKSYQMFTGWLEDEYGKYSVLEFLPDITVTPTAEIGGKIYYNLNQSADYFGAINFTNEHLYLSSNTGGLGKCLQYDFNNLQSWVYDIQNETREEFCSAASYKLYFDSTSSTYDEYKAWVTEMISYYEKSRQIDYQNFLLDIDANEIIPYTQEYYDFFYNNYIENLTFAAHSTYPIAYLAPKYYHDPLDEFELVSAYTALDSGITSFKSYKEHEEYVNDQNSLIKVIDPSVIDTFVEAFYERLNV